MARTTMVRRWRRNMECVTTRLRRHAEAPSPKARCGATSTHTDIDLGCPEFAVTPDDERWILPETDVFGRHPWYRAQPVAGQIAIGQWRQANVAKVGLQFESILIRGLMNYVFWVPNGSPEYRYCTHEAIEEGNHTLMFQEMVNRIGVDVPGMPRLLRWIVSVDPLVPGRCRSRSSSVCSPARAHRPHPEERAARGQELHPIMEKVMAIHVAEEARHISFAHEYLRKRLPHLNRRQRLLLSVNVPLIMRILCQAIWCRRGLLPGTASRWRSDELFFRSPGIAKVVAGHVRRRPDALLRHQS